MAIGDSRIRVDAYAKVTGEAKYVADLQPKHAYVAKIVRATIANGIVTGFDLDAARAVPGVIAVYTCFDVPDHVYPTAGHPWSVEPEHQDVADRRILNTRVRVYGDEIAVVVAENSVAATRAARLVHASYEEYPVLRTPQEAIDAPPLHPELHKTNVMGHSAFRLGDLSYEEAQKLPGVIEVSGEYGTSAVQHCHLEPIHSYAYEENGKIVVVSSTQIPHIVRRVVGQALGIPWGKVRVMKPYIGGGFGNKQDVQVEPLAAWLTTKLGGHPVGVELTREEVFTCTHVRHPFTWQVRGLVTPDGTLIGRRYRAWSNQGGYSPHGHGIAANAANMFKQAYQDRRALDSESWTVYTNCTTAGAMRAYGIPQGAFVTEALTDDLAHAIGMDPLEFRLKNCMPEGYVDPHTGIPCLSYGLKACMERGAEKFEWAKKREMYQNQSGNVRRGVGMAIFIYKTGVYPIALETAACRMALNQDGSIQLQMGATEIGQGADTVFTQMAAASTGISEEKVHILSMQDTDVTPFDSGAYASRQSYVSGMAVKKTGEALRAKILDYAAWLLDCPVRELHLHDDAIWDDTGAQRMTMEQLAMEACYSRRRTEHIAAEETVHCTQNTFSTGCCFAEVEVDIPLGKVRVLRLLNVHDSGTILNPKLAEAQVHGGMSMGLGYALSEELLYDDKCRPRNGNLLDYKLPTSMDSPEFEAMFVEIPDPSGPFGNKALGEPPAIPVAPAVRNAVLHATGVAVNSLPLSPQKLIEHFRCNGLL
ncbi:MAG: xanthine dehydrogenase molybdenum-binding subunit XdhA [Butyricicoccus pullicaecorum]|nr:xanthine dehydrogenase molybdenum-binding subunit XdhA [Butyricicoccus pullicaecorum]